MKIWQIHLVYLVLILVLSYLAINTNRTLHSMSLQYAALVKTTAHSSAPSASSSQHIIPLSQPNMDNFGLQVWANTVAVQAYSYDFLNYKKQFSALAQYFTADAWDQFQHAIQKSNMLNIALAEKMSVSAVARGAVTLTQQGVDAGHYTWHVLLPLQVTLANSNKKLQQQVIANITIIRVQPPLGKLGLAIQRFNVSAIPKTSS